MKKYILTLIISMCFLPDLLAQSTQAPCCPEFILKSKDIVPCSGDTECARNMSAAGDMGSTWVACKNQYHQYLVVPNLPGYSFYWNVVSGTVVSPGANPVTILWENHTHGLIQVIIVSADNTCRDTISQEVCLINSPIAIIGYSPNQVCMNSNVSFTGNQSIGGNYYFWDFGDGNYSNDLNPQHQYTQSGSYTVTLSVSNISFDNKEGIKFCGCSDTAQVVIHVLSQQVMEIIPDCKKMLCFGDTTTYSTATNCQNVQWTVNGGNIIGSANNQQVTVVWNNPGVFPTSITLNASCPGSCGNSARLEVPVLFNNIPIEGPTNVCTGSGAMYSLPAMPGTFYTWSITPATAGTIVGESLNNNQIKVLWGSSTGGPYTISCTYQNPYSHCNGNSSLQVFINPRFILTGPATACVGNSSNYTASANSSWTISPNSGFTFTPTANSQQKQITWLAPGNYSVTASTITPNSYCNTSATSHVAVNAIPQLSLTGESTVCSNQVYEYSASSDMDGGNYTWSLTQGSGTIAPFGENNSSVSVSFTGAGQWILEVIQIVNGCIGSSTLYISKIPAPTLPATTITTCIGGQVSATVTTGTGPFTWSTSSDATLISGQGTSGATYEIHSNSQITVSNCGGTSNAINITATLPPAIDITKTGSLCTGNLQLSAPSGESYQWYGGSTATSQTINVTAPGNYTVQVTSQGGCKSVDSYTVAPEQIPTVSISTGDPIRWCYPTTPLVNLQAFTLSSGCTYQWFRNGNLVGSNPIYTATLPGSYFVKVICGGCVATSNTITIIQELCPGGCDLPNPLSAITVTGCNPKTFSVNVTGCAGEVVNWHFGDGSSVTGTTVTHTYASEGVYSATASIVCNNCYFTVHKPVEVPVNADFNFSATCLSNGNNSIDLINASQKLSAWNVSNISWASSCGTPSSASGNTITLTTPSGCNPTVTMTITVIKASTNETCTDTKTLTVNLPSTSLSINGPDNVCKDQTYQFISNMTTGIVQYLWKVNGVSVSQNNSLSYAFSGTPPNPVITLSVIHQNGCIYTATKTITVKTPATLTITGPTSVCPDCPPTGSLSISNSSNFNNYQWYQNGVAIHGATESAYQLCTNAMGNYYATAHHISTSCTVTSNTVQVVYKLKPIAKIIGSAVQCGANFSLSSVSNNNCTYLWTSTNQTVNFNPNNAITVNITANPSLIPYQIILTVTDNVTLCAAKDTLCLFVFTKPTVSIQPAGAFCEQTPNTFTATALPATSGFSYLWSNGVAGPNMTTAMAGSYSVIAVENVSGCAGQSNAVQIKKLPYVGLFPSGCDTICDTMINNMKLIPPLPTIQGAYPNFNYNDYTIKWYDNNNHVHTGESLPLTNLSSPLLGLHNIKIEATLNGCSSMSHTYNLFIEPCNSSCNCNGSSFTNLTYTESVDPRKIHQFNCGSQMLINCQNPFTFNANFICSDPVNCPPSVLFSLLNSQGNTVQSGPMPFSTAGLSAGSYTLLISGQCNGVTCNTCMVSFIIQCEAAPCCPQMQLINVRNSNENLTQQTYQGNAYSLYTTNVSIIGGNVPFTEVRATVVDFELSANYNKCIECTNYPFTWASLSASSLAGITPRSTGTTPSVGYFVPSNIFGNPREVVWNNNNALIDLSMPQSTNLSIFLPPNSSIPCCGLKAKICVKFSLYDINCNLCEIVKCYEITIGETAVGESCCCEKWQARPVYITRGRIVQTNSVQKDKKANVSIPINPTPVPTPIGWRVECGGTIKLSNGLYFFSVPAFYCSPTSCNATYNWMIGGSSAGQVFGSGTGSSFTHHFSSPGKYTITITPKCGACLCPPCTFNVVIGKKVSPTVPLTSPSVNNYGINDEGIKRTTLQTFASVNSFGMNDNQLMRTGEPVPGAEVYIELESDEDPIINVTTNENGEFNFETADVPNFPQSGTFNITVVPSKAFAKSKNIPLKKQKIKVRFKTPEDGKFQFILFWEQQYKAENRGSFAVSGKNST